MATYGSLFFTFGLVKLGGLAFVLGVIFLLMWASKTQTAADLKRWGLWLLGIGVVIALLAIGSGGMALGKMGTGGMKGPGTFMMRLDGGMGGMMMRGGGGMGMMSNMGMMLEGLEGDEFDEAFIEMMIPHHEGAIDMAEEALKSAKHAELKALAEDIIEAQQREIDMMKAWAKSWGYED